MRLSLHTEAIMLTNDQLLEFVKNYLCSHPGCAPWVDPTEDHFITVARSIEQAVQRAILSATQPAAVDREVSKPVVAQTYQVSAGAQWIIVTEAQYNSWSGKKRIAHIAASPASPAPNDDYEVDHGTHIERVPFYNPDAAPSVEQDERERFYAQGLQDGIRIGETRTASTSANVAQGAEAFPYQKTFNAIAAATSISGGHVAISVAKFVEAFGAAPPAPPALADEQIIERCKAAGIKWIAPEPDDQEGSGFPGMFDMATMDEMRAALTAAQSASGNHDADQT
jgi:hypothetical protein